MNRQAVALCKRLFMMLACLALVSGTAQAGEAKRPNILFCLADDWGWPHAGVYGDEVVQTPAFDRIAREGVLYERAFVSSPSCTPSRNAIITGQHFFRLGVGANLWSTLDADYPNFMFLLRDAGYTIGHHRKAWGPGDFKRGGYKEHPCGPESNLANFMQQRDPSKPFCFWLGTSDPHRGYQEGLAKQAGIDASRIQVPGFYPDTQVIKEDIAEYYFEVQRWDRDVAHALEVLEQAGELENTIIVMTGDHGMPFPRCKGNLYDWGTRVPLAIRWGNQIAAGQVVAGPVSLVDLAPTFLALAGVSIPEVMTGKALPLGPGPDTPTQDTPADESEGAVVIGRERHVPSQAAGTAGGYPMRALRTERYLYIRNYFPDRWPAGAPGWIDTYTKDAWFADCDNGPAKFTIILNREFDTDHRWAYQLCFDKRPREELYDTRVDPDNLFNLADQPAFAQLKASLSDRLDQRLDELDDPRSSDPTTPLDEPYYLGGGGGKTPDDATRRRFTIEGR